MGTPEDLRKVRLNPDATDGQRAALKGCATTNGLRAALEGPPYCTTYSGTTYEYTIKIR
jgi:hypothetical protein